MSEPCSVDGCFKPARPGSKSGNGLCWAHTKRKQRGVPMSEEVRYYGATKRERFAEGVYQLIETPGMSKEDQERAIRRLWMTVVRKTNRRRGSST